MRRSWYIRAGVSSTLDRRSETGGAGDCDCPASAILATARGDGCGAGRSAFWRCLLVRHRCRMLTGGGLHVLATALSPTVESADSAELVKQSANDVFPRRSRRRNEFGSAERCRQIGLPGGDTALLANAENEFSIPSRWVRVRQPFAVVVRRASRAALVVLSLAVDCMLIGCFATQCTADLITARIYQ